MSKPAYFFLLALAWFGSAFVALKARGDEQAPGPIQRELHRIAAPGDDPVATKKRLRRYAVIIEDAAKARPYPTRRDMTIALIAIGESESHFDEGVCEDFTRRPAVGCWQHEVQPLPESVEESADNAARLLSWAWRQCGTFEGAVSLYATGRWNPDGSPFCGPWGGAQKRVAAFNRIAGRL
jgi:hypothetical protein